MLGCFSTRAGSGTEPHLHTVLCVSTAEEPALGPENLLIHKDNSVLAKNQDLIDIFSFILI